MPPTIWTLCLDDAHGFALSWAGMFAYGQKCTWIFVGLYAYNSLCLVYKCLQCLCVCDLNLCGSEPSKAHSISEIPWRKTPLLSCYFNLALLRSLDEYAAGGYWFHKSTTAEEINQISLYQSSLNSYSNLSLVPDKAEVTAVSGTVIVSIEQWLPCSTAWTRGFHWAAEGRRTGKHLFWLQESPRAVVPWRWSPLPHTR